jgi:hypothetical protein
LSPPEESEVADPSESVLPFRLAVGNFGVACRIAGGLGTAMGDFLGVPLLYWMGWAGRGELLASPGVFGTAFMRAGLGARAGVTAGAGAGTAAGAGEAASVTAGARGSNPAGAAAGGCSAGVICMTSSAPSAGLSGSALNGLGMLFISDLGLSCLTSCVGPDLPGKGTTRGGWEPGLAASGPFSCPSSWSILNRGRLLIRGGVLLFGGRETGASFCLGDTGASGWLGAAGKAGASFCRGDGGGASAGWVTAARASSALGSLAQGGLVEEGSGLASPLGGNSGGLQFVG